jgi:glutathione S-transferase
MLKIWGRRNAFNVQKVMWLIGELGLDHERVDAGGSFGGLDAPDFLRMNPHGRIPVIEDKGTIIWESQAIIRYLAARHARGTLWPTEAAARSFADRWMDWSLATLQPAFLDLFWGYYRTPAEKRDRSFIDKAIERCDRCYRLLDSNLSDQPYLAGERFTMGDVPAGTTLFRYRSLNIKRPLLRNVEAWYRRLAERPAYREHVMIPFDDLFGRLEY